MRPYEQLLSALRLSGDRLRPRILIGAAALSLAGLLEMIGIGMIFPLAQLLVNDNALNENEALAEIAALLSVETGAELLPIAAFALISILILRALFSFAVLSWMNFQILTAQGQFMTRLLMGYIHAPMTFLQARNSADLTRDSHASVNAVFAGTLFSFIHICVEATLIASLIALLIYADPTAALASGGLALVGGVLIYAAFGRTIDRASSRRQVAQGEATRLTYESLELVRDIRARGRESYFEEKIFNNRQILSKCQTILNILELAPRFLFEIILAVTVAILLLILTSRYDGQEILVFLALYGVALIRLLPAAGRLVSHFNRFRSALPGVRQVLSDVDILRDVIGADGWGRDRRVATTPRLEMRRRIDLRDVRFAYEADAQPVLRGVDMTIEQGASIGVVGPSGAGKSTLISLLLGFHSPTAGRILMDGVDLGDRSPYERNIGYVPQTIAMLDGTIRENVAFGVFDDAVDDDRVWAALDDAQLAAVVRAFPNGLDEPVGERGERLSGGQRQRLGIARALYDRPNVLVLDEATSALDLETEASLNAVLAGLHGRKTIIVIAHRLSTVEKCDVIYFMTDGRIVDQGDFQSLFDRNETFANLVRLGNVVTAAA